MLTRKEAMRAGGLRPAAKWAARLAVVFALGGGEAAAQLIPDPTFDGNGLKVDVASRVTEGAGTTITVTVRASVAASQPAADVTVNFSDERGSADATNEEDDILIPTTATLSFPANTTSSAVTHTISSSIPLQTNHDLDAEDETVVLAISASGPGISINAGNQAGDEPRRRVTIDDDETQSYVVALAPGAVPREGEAFRLVVSADPDHDQETKELTLQIDGAGYVLDTSADDGNQRSGTLSSTNTSFTATVTPPPKDGNRTDDAVTVKAYSGTVGNATEEASRTFTVADAHALPAPAAVTVEVKDTAGRPATSVAEGGAVDLTISVDRGRGAAATTGEALSVALALAPADPAHASSYRLTPARVTLPAVATPGKQSATAVRLEALADEFVGDDRLTVNLTTTGEADNGAGSVDSSFSIAVQDTTAKKVSAKSDAAVKQAFDAARTAAQGADGLNPGEAFSVAATDLFEGIAAGSTVVYSALSSDPSVRVATSGAAVTVTAVSAGSATVRVTARVTGSSSASFVVPQTRSDEAAVEQVVAVADKPLRVALTADPAATVEEGGTITLTATANRAVLAGDDGTVRLTVIGPVVAPPSSLTVAVGATSATAALTVQDDDEVKDLGSVTVIATGGSLATDPTRLDIAVTEDDIETVYTYTFTASASRVTEGGAATLTVTAKPPVEAETVVALTASPVSLAGDYTLVPSSITLAAGGTSGTAELRVTDDEEVEDPETLTVTATDPGKVLIGTVEIVLVDNDAATVAAKPQAEVDRVFADAVAAAAGPDGWTPGGRAAVLDARALFTVAEGAAVTYAARSSDPAVVTAATTAATVTLEPAAAGAATITVTVVDSASGAIATASSAVAVTEAPLRVALAADPAASVEEGGTITLTATANRAVLAADDATVRLSVVGPVVEPPSSVTIAVGASTAAAVLTVVDDDEVKDLGSVTVVATGGGLATDPTRLDIAVTEDDIETVYTYTFAASAARVTEGGAVTLAVTATPQVEAETVIALTASPVSLADDYTLVPSSITLAAGGTSGTAELRATDDAEVEDPEVLTVTATDPGKVLIGTVEIVIVDNDTPSVVAKPQAEVDKAFTDAVAAAAGPDGWAPGGRAAVLDARALFTVAEGAAVTYVARSSDPAVVAAATSATTVTLEPVAAGAATITVTATDSATGAIATASSGVGVGAAVATYTLSGPADANLVEGRSYELRVTGTTATAADAAFTLRRDRAASDAGDDDFTLEPASIVIPAGATEGTAVLTVAADGVDEGPEALVLFAATADRGEVGSLTFTLWDSAVPALPLAAQLLLAALLAVGGCRRYLRRR